ncbi:MAG: 2Fe-2S iron-sulfur cluster-binding protein [Spongiibacteraceae bacterium]
MTRITYIEHSGAEHVLDIENGLSLMQAALNNSVRGIIGDCGGACSCATCHVYVDPAWLDKTGPRSEAEESLLEEVCDVQTNSRLSCQIQVSPDLDGLVVRLPAKQV